jgi:hypothetical protein
MDQIFNLEDKDSPKMRLTAELSQNSGKPEL